MSLWLLLKMQVRGLAAIVVTTPQIVAIQDVAKSIHFLGDMNVPVVGLVENMSSFICPDCEAVHDIFENGGGKKLAKDTGVNYLGDIPIDMEITNSG